MDPEAQERHRQLQAQLDELDKRAIERLERAEREQKLFELRMARAEERADRADERMDRAEERADRADARMDRFDKQLQATKKLVEAGMKIVMRQGTMLNRLEAQAARTHAEVQDLARIQKAFLKSFHNGRNGHNGSSRRRS